ncbi:hypothetical protein Psed_1124 [Pseudonocardia dioxanivorans CB1190]|uniref:Helix-turn-helix domain-containing protein n=1 Tax=Pseudonocardia dioxanivorans (strain ATCC 55486 / DSM 44775 / JCM 13855 / CB1190) TaxID=675635 RepID=F4CSH0_PSEUX|nr:helix-turn-helix domain-containing protein [Pseudonocardia dioxanivorans]AEA23375.1 hypothetical protein Psed_1124 [Pseudonocardia dioxanivorans CB1190]
MSSPAAHPTDVDPTASRSTVDIRSLTADLPALITIPRAADLLGLSRASAYRYAAAGELPTKRFGRRVYVITHRIRALFDDESGTAPALPGEAA